MKYLLAIGLLLSLIIACGGDSTSENTHRIQQGNVEFTLDIPQEWESNTRKAELSEGMEPLLFAGRQYMEFENSFVAQVEIHYAPEIIVPSGYTREQEVDLLDSYGDGYTKSPKDHLQITENGRGEFARYPALLFTTEDDGTFGAKSTSKHIAFLADRRLWVFQCMYRPVMDEENGTDESRSCERIIASVAAK